VNVPECDPDGNILSTTTTDGAGTHTQTATFDAEDRQTSGTDDGATTTYGYDAAGQRRTETLPGGATTLTTGLDPEGRTTALTDTTSGVGAATSLFGYNANDQPVTRPLPGAARTRVLMDGLMIMVAVATFSWYDLLGPTVLRGDASVAVKVVGAASTLGDLVLIVCLLLLWARAGDGAMQRVVRPLALGLGVIVVTDGAFDYGTLRGTYATGGLVDVGWPLGYMLVGLAALALRQARAQPAAARAPAPLLPARPVRRIARLWRCAKPYLPYALVPAVLALVGNARAARGHVAAALELGVYLGGGLLIGLVLVRQWTAHMTGALAHIT